MINENEIRAEIVKLVKIRTELELVNQSEYGICGRIAALNDDIRLLKDVLHYTRCCPWEIYENENEVNEDKTCFISDEFLKALEDAGDK